MPPGVTFGCYLNSGQTCSALTRMVVPRDKQDEVVALAKADGRDHRRRPRRQRRPARPARLGHPARPGARLHPEGHRRGRHARHRRGRRARGPRHRLLREAHGLRRRHHRHDHRPGGDLRPGARRSCPTTTRTRPSRIANDTIYGLSGGVQSADVERAKAVRPPDAHRPGRTSTRAPTTSRRRSVATSSRATAASWASSASTSSSRPSPCSSTTDPERIRSAGWTVERGGGGLRRPRSRCCSSSLRARPSAVTGAAARGRGDGRRLPDAWAAGRHRGHGRPGHRAPGRLRRRPAAVPGRPAGGHRRGGRRSRSRLRATRPRPPSPPTSASRDSGHWAYDGALDLRRVDGAWRVVFTPASLHPALTDGARLQRVREPRGPGRHHRRSVANPWRSAGLASRARLDELAGALIGGLREVTAARGGPARPGVRRR